MSDKPRRFWQIHLSTAVMMNVLVGLLIFINITPRTSIPAVMTNTDSDLDLLIHLANEPSIVGFTHERGWPTACYRNVIFANTSG